MKPKQPIKRLGTKDYHTRGKIADELFYITLLKTPPTSLKNSMLRASVVESLVDIRKYIQRLKK